MYQVQTPLNPLPPGEGASARPVDELRSIRFPPLVLIFHEWTSRDRGDECATGQPQGVGAEAYLHSTSQGPTREDARKDGHIRGRSRPFMKDQD